MPPEMKKLLIQRRISRIRGLTGLKIISTESTKMNIQALPLKMMMNLIAYVGHGRFRLAMIWRLKGF
jgi:hypothetical protein